jgi:hypothetical protein
MLDLLKCSDRNLGALALRRYGAAVTDAPRDKSADTVTLPPGAVQSAEILLQALSVDSAHDDGIKDIVALHGLELLAVQAAGGRDPEKIVELLHKI